MKKSIMRFGAAFFASLFMVQSATACTGVYVGKDLTTDGSVIFGRTEDLEENHDKSFEIIPEGTVKAGETITNDSEDNGFTYTPTTDNVSYQATPDNPASTYGDYHEAGFNANGVAMDATTTAYTNDKILAIDGNVETGIAEQIMTNAVLGHATSARHGVELLASMIDKEGAMESNGLIIADQKETWYMEIISGHQYAAMKLPDDMYAVFPNSLFIQSIDVNDKENYIVSKDIEKVATEAGTIVRDEAGRINVAASYAAQMTLGSASRYWSGVKAIDPDAVTPLDGDKLTSTQLKEMLPTIQAWPYLRTMATKDHKVSIEDVMAFQRNRFEGTSYTPEDNAASATGAGDAATKADMSLYPIGNKNTMEAHIFQIHQDMPANVPGTMWLAMGSPNTAPYLPYFGNITKTADPYKALTEEEFAIADDLGYKLNRAKRALIRNTDPSKTAELQKAYDEAVKAFAPYKEKFADKSFYWASSILLDELLANEPENREKFLAAVENIESAQIKRYEALRAELIARYSVDPKAAADWYTELSICVANQAFADLQKVRAGTYQIDANKSYATCGIPSGETTKPTPGGNSGVADTGAQLSDEETTVEATEKGSKVGGTDATITSDKVKVAEKSAETLPKTGETTSLLVNTLATLSILAGGYILIRKK